MSRTQQQTLKGETMRTALYLVDGETFTSFSEAVRVADSRKSNVIEIATGRQRWSPAPPVGIARLERYRDQKAAYEAQQRLAARK